MFFITSLKLLYHFFFVDLEPAINKNKEIFVLEYLCYTKIKVEAPKPKNQIPQCMNCQDYGHTRSYTDTVHLDAFVVVIITAQPLVRKATNFQQNAPFVLAIIQKNYRGCSALKKIQTYHNRHSKVINNHHLNNKTNSTKIILM